MPTEQILLQREYEDGYLNDDMTIRHRRKPRIVYINGEYYLLNNSDLNTMEDR